MSYYGMDTDVVQSVGRQIFVLEPEATAAVNGVLSAYLDASGVVYHPVVTAAMSSYHDTHQKGHLAFAQAVGTVGSNLANGGRAIADGNNEASSVQSASLATQQRLSRQLNSRL